MKRFTVWGTGELSNWLQNLTDGGTDQSDFILGDPPPEARPTPFASPIIFKSGCDYHFSISKRPARVK